MKVCLAMLSYVQPGVTPKPLEFTKTLKIYVAFFILPIILLNFPTWMQMYFQYVGYFSICFLIFLFFPALSSAKIHQKLKHYQLGTMCGGSGDSITLQINLLQSQN